MRQEHEQKKGGSHNGRKPETRDALLGRYVFDVFPETDARRTIFEQAFLNALRGETNLVVKQPFSIPDPRTGELREVWWTCHHFPVFDGNGQIVAMMQKAEDVTAAVSAERMRDVVSQEFNHRVKNILSTITSIARTGTEGCIGDGKIFVLPTLEAITIDDGQRGPGAV